MATRSIIGIENEDGTVSSIYCHWDGYVSHNGKILAIHYRDREKVKELIALGSISSLGKMVSPPIEELEGESDDASIKKGKSLLERSGFYKPLHTFDNPMEGVTLAYHRDRGEEYRPPNIHESFDSYFGSDLESYGYLFTLNGEWLVKCYDGPIETVNEVLANGYS